MKNRRYIQRFKIEIAEKLQNLRKKMKIKSDKSGGDNKKEIRARWEVSAQPLFLVSVKTLHVIILGTVVQ